MNKAFASVCMASAALLSACGAHSESSRIVSRVASPDGARDAVYEEDIGGGATVAPSEEVYVVAKGGSPRLQDRVFSEEHLCHLKVRWLNNDAIEIGYSARKALADDSKTVGRINVQARWLGRDAASGC